MTTMDQQTHEAAAKDGESALAPGVALRLKWEGGGIFPRFNRRAMIAFGWCLCITSSVQKTAQALYRSCVCCEFMGRFLVLL